MSLKRITRKEYNLRKNRVPEHPKKVIQDMKPNLGPSLYYTRERIFDEEEHLVLIHEFDGSFWGETL